MSLFPPFLKWGQYQSKDEKKPDVIKIKVKDHDTFETEFSVNVEVEIYEKNEWSDINIPLKSHESKNNALLNLWTRATKEGKIKEGDIVFIRTYLGKSRNNRPIRRFSLAKN